MKTPAILFSAVLMLTAACASKESAPSGSRDDAPVAAKDASNGAATEFKDVKVPDEMMAMISDPDEKEPLYLLDFYADWCGPCRQLKPYMEKWEDEYDGIIDFETINVDEEPGLAGKFNIEAIPTVIIIDRSGKVVSRVEGFQPEVIANALKSAASRYSQR